MSRHARVRSTLSVVADVASIGSALAIVSFAVVMTWSFVERTTPTRERMSASGTLPRPLITPVHDLETTENGSTERPRHARIALVEFSDYECPFCGGYARGIYPRLRKEFVDTGRVAYVFRNFPLENVHSLAFRASEAAECAREQGRYWEMHDRLFVDQADLSESRLHMQAEELGLDGPSFQSCMRTGRAAAVKSDQVEGHRLGVRGTPTFFIGEIQPGGKITLKHRMTGAPRYETFRAILEQALASHVARSP